ncbi:MAG: hypothetical protein OXH92_02410, partial [Bryobacterales bacterium]|nr:hypothetical protein [Bryobacterales bacterium]
MPLDRRLHHCRTSYGRRIVPSPALRLPRRPYAVRHGERRRSGGSAKGLARESVGPRHSCRSLPMTDPVTISADYTLR